MDNCITMINIRDLEMIIWCWIQTKTVYNFRARKSHCCASEAFGLGADGISLRTD